MWYNQCVMTHIIPIDISSSPDLVRLAEEVAATKKSRLLRVSGENVAILTPLKPTKRRETKSEKTLGEDKRFRLGVGAWKDIDAREMIAKIYRWRAEGSRPAIKPQ